MEYNSIIAENLKKARKEKKFRQKDIADHLGVKISTVSSWEIGANAISADSFIQICDFLGVSTETIAGRIPQGITPSEMDMLRKFREIDRTQQEMILSSLETAYAVTKKGNVSAYVTA